ncbi:O-antigen ligase family protein [Deinococcus sp. VB142]|uniref:O-antigen ligase family protein n=1 Tax=Deinococcus sp. VB142 TaxID=3112952 RepID=A0AAU6PZ16_9DEIO
MKVVAKKINVILFNIILFFIICYPLQFQMLKIELFGAIVLVALIGKVRIRISTFTGAFLFLTVAYNLWNLMIGSFAGYSPFPYFSLYIFSPLIYIFMFSVLRDYLRSKEFILSLTLMLLYISILDINAILQESGKASVSLLSNLFTGRVGIHEGYTQIVDYNVYSLFFLLPFIFNVILYRMTNMAFALPVGLISLLALILTGRRALWSAVLVAIIVSFVIYLIRVFESRNKKRLTQITVVGMFALIGLLVVLIYAFSSQNVLSLLDGLRARFLDAFTDNGGLGVRNNQQTALISDWLKSPVFGNGIAVPASVIRSQDFLTAYEATYHALLYQIGLIGFLLYSVPTVVALFSLLRPRGKQTEWTLRYAVGAGLLSILLGISTNPYFGSFDGLWMLFLPIMIYDDIFLSKDPQDYIINNSSKAMRLEEKV